VCVREDVALSNQQGIRNQGSVTHALIHFEGSYPGELPDANGLVVAGCGDMGIIA
jgi:hypothetical protein